MSKQTELAKITLRKEVPLIQIIEQPIKPSMNGKFRKFQSYLLTAILVDFLTMLIFIYTLIV